MKYPLVNLKGNVVNKKKIWLVHYDEKLNRTRIELPSLSAITYNGNLLAEFLSELNDSARDDRDVKFVQIENYLFNVNSIVVTYCSNNEKTFIHYGNQIITIKGYHLSSLYE